MAKHRYRSASKGRYAAGRRGATTSTEAPQWLWLARIAGACRRFASPRRRAEAASPAVTKTGIVSDPAPVAQQAAAFVPRCGEDARAHFRSERLFAVGHRWYFATREGENVGPYRDRREAELALATFVARRVEEQMGAGVDFGDRPPGANAFEAMVAELVEYLRQRRQRSDTGAYVWALKRTQTLRGRVNSEAHASARAAALEYVLGEADKEHGFSSDWSIEL